MTAFSASYAQNEEYQVVVLGCAPCVGVDVDLNKRQDWSAKRDLGFGLSHLVLECGRDECAASMLHEFNAEAIAVSNGGRRHGHDAASPCIALACFRSQSACARASSLIT